MGTDKPRIAILMAVYEPRMDWLREQLGSLDAQTYPNLKLYIRDDCSPTVPFEEIEACIKECIRSFSYEIKRNEENLGSNGTFERLTEEAEGKYFAYCDQDDIWLPEKLTILQQEIEVAEAVLICSDMYIIDGKGKVTADSITKVRRHHKFRSGENLASGLLISNFATGCAMLVRSGTAKASTPFCPYMVHDHYLALYSATKGKIVSLPQKLIRYRVHEANQTLMMAGVHDKASYFEIRIMALVKRLEWLQTAFGHEQELSVQISKVLLWARARAELFQGGKQARKTILQYRRYSPLTSIFEVVMSGAPEPIFMWAVELKRRNFL